ncbi:MAG: bis(5'-nucleosyl)-tetraphosphatase (symmetrical) YqeK [Thermostichales cyanobacterium DRC_bins_46]
MDCSRADPELRQRILTWLGQHTPAPRLRHILGVERLAADLAAHHGWDPQRAAWAGLLHDAAKYFPPEQLLAVARRDPQVTLDPILEGDPQLLHAEVSAWVAAQEFGITDQEVLQAIRDHTLGRPEMGGLSCVLFVADALEPNRGDNETLRRLRQLVYEDLTLGVAEVADYGLSWLLGKPKLIHPRTLAVRNAFWQRHLLG